MPGRTGREGEFSGRAWNATVDDAITFYQETRGFVMEQLHADGFPPFTVRTDPATRQVELLGSRDRQASAFGLSAEANRDLGGRVADSGGALDLLGGGPR